MAAAPRESVSLRTIKEADCATRVLVNTAIGAGVGFIGAVAALTFRAPSASPALNTGAIFRNLCLDIMPLTTGGAAVYSLVSCSVESNRVNRDWRNAFAGGAAAGALVVGIKQKKLIGASLGALGFGFAAAGVDIAQNLDATPQETARGDINPKKYIPATADYAQNAAASASFARQKLQ